MYEVVNDFLQFWAVAILFRLYRKAFCVGKKSYRSVNIALILQHVYIYYSKGDMKSDFFFK